MASRDKKQTGLGADAFFQSPPAEKRQPSTASHAKKPVGYLQDERPERRSFNLKPSTLRLLDEIQIKSMREGKKSTLSAIIEQGITLVAKKKGVGE